MSAPMVKAASNGAGHTYGLDLDAKRAARQAAGNEGLRYMFKLGDREWTLRPANEWPANVKALMAEGDLAEVMDAILEQDSAAFWAIRPRPSVQDINDVIEAWSEWSGTGDLPNSPGSPPPLSTRT